MRNGNGELWSDDNKPIYQPPLYERLINGVDDFLMSCEGMMGIMLMIVGCLAMVAFSIWRIESRK